MRWIEYDRWVLPMPPPSTVIPDPMLARWPVWQSGKLVLLLRLQR